MIDNKKHKNNKNLEIVKGDGKSLNISLVEDHIKIEKPNKTNQKEKKIVIPKSKKK